MKLSLETLAVLAAVSTVALASNAAHDEPLRRRQHHSISRMTDSQLSRRAEQSKWTWYDTEESGNPGACGTHIKNYENAVAWPLSEFNAKEHCFKKVTVSYKGRTEVATVLDACEACPHEGLDLSKGLFEKMTSLGDGIVFGSWTWSEGGGDEPQQSTNPPQTTPTPTSTKEADPTTTPTSTSSSTSTREEPTSDRVSTTPSQEPAPTTTSSSSSSAQPSNARARVASTTPSTTPASSTPPAATSSSTPPAAPSPAATSEPAVKAAAPTTAVSSSNDIVVGKTIRVCKKKATSA